MKHSLIILIALLSFPFWAKAESGCPTGYYPYNTNGVNNCIPIPGYEPPPPRYTGPIWEDRWGAIVNGKTVEGYSDFGAAAGLKAEREARRAAMDNCRSKGLQRCKLLTTYYNQCAVWIGGDSWVMAYTAETSELAETNGLRSCSNKTTNCTVYYSACSHQERIQ